MFDLPTIRDIGTSYAGKEPTEHTSDVLRAVAATGGYDIGFVACLTSRPFTVRTHVAGRSGAFSPGREHVDAEARARLDLADALEMFVASGFAVDRTQVGEMQEEASGRCITLLGPALFSDRWCPPEDRLFGGRPYRYLVAAGSEPEWVHVIDPVAGGQVALRRTECCDLESVRVVAPTEPVDLDALATACLARGATWRVAARADDQGASRDGPGLRALASDSLSLAAGLPAVRLRLSVWNYGLHALQWGRMLGAIDRLTTDHLALADALTTTRHLCAQVDEAARRADAGALERTLVLMADVADGVTELAARAVEAGA